MKIIYGLLPASRSRLTVKANDGTIKMSEMIEIMATPAIIPVIPPSPESSKTNPNNPILIICIANHAIQKSLRDAQPEKSLNW